MPKILIFDEPTKGIDVGTKNDLYGMMKKIVDEKGISIILVSSELEELLRCSNRIITVYNGEKVGEFETENTKESEILNSILGENIKNSTESIL
jgi:ribose transport system ATP-binding protein